MSQISRLNIKGSKQNNLDSALDAIWLFEMDADDNPIIIRGKENMYQLPDVMRYIHKFHPYEIRVSGNKLNGKSIIQLVNSLLEYPYQLIQNKYKIDYNKYLDNKQYTGESLIFRAITNK